MLGLVERTISARKSGTCTSILPHYRRRRKWPYLLAHCLAANVHQTSVKAVRLEWKNHVKVGIGMFAANTSETCMTTCRPNQSMRIENIPIIPTHHYNTSHASSTLPQSSGSRYESCLVHVQLVQLVHPHPPSTTILLPSSATVSLRPNLPERPPACCA